MTISYWENVEAMSRFTEVTLPRSITCRATLSSSSKSPRVFRFYGSTKAMGELARVRLSTHHVTSPAGLALTSASPTLWEPSQECS